MLYPVYSTKLNQLHSSDKKKQESPTISKQETKNNSRTPENISSHYPLKKLNDSYAITETNRQVVLKK